MSLLYFLSGAKTTQTFCKVSQLQDVFLPVIITIIFIGLNPFTDSNNYKAFFTYVLITTTSFCLGAFSS